MKGGNRLTEEERWKLICFFNTATPDSEDPIYDTIKRELLEMLERDDEPEYCTCKDGPTCNHGREGTFSTQECGRCGKPVKGE